MLHPTLPRHSPPILRPTCAATPFFHSPSPLGAPCGPSSSGRLLERDWSTEKVMGAGDRTRGKNPHTATSSLS